MATVTVNWSSHYLRADQHTATIEVDDYAMWAAVKRLPQAISQARLMDVLEFIKDNHITYSTGTGELDFDEHANYSLEVDLPAEFTEKQQELAVFLHNLCNEPVADIDALRAQGDYYINYMQDADEVLRSQPHLLGLGTREEMGLEP